MHPKVENLDLERFSRKILNDENRSGEITPETVEISEMEYRRFLTLKVENPEVTLTPTPLMDLFWHAHILDTMSYARDCEEIFGRFMHMSLTSDLIRSGISFDDDRSWEDMCTLYKERFGEEPVFLGKDGAANCSVDDCHGLQGIADLHA